MKDAYYFSHDSNMWNDPKIIKVRRKHGMVGYGLVNRLNEMLRNEKDNRLGLDEDTLDDIVFDINDKLICRDVLEDVILHFKLYEREDSDDNEFGYFYSKRMRRNMEKMEEIKQKRSYAGQMSGKARQVLNTSSTNVQQNSTRKGKENKENKLKVRSALFFKQLTPFENEFGKETIVEFHNYWSEPNKNGNKMRFEMEKTWDAKRRLSRWSNNDFGNNKNNGVSEFKLDTTGNAHIAYCNKCRKSDFYRKEELKQDSRCCKSKLLPEKPSAVR